MIETLDAPEVVFDEDTHTYTIGGLVMPRSVSGLIKKYGLTNDLSKIPPAILEKAKQRGNAYAAGRTLILQGFELDPTTIDPEIECYLAAFAKFWKESEAELIETEVPRVSPLGFGFKADIYCWINGRRAVVDDKCTYALPKSIGPQTAGYQIGWNSLYARQPVEDRYGLWLKKDGTYKAPLLDDPDDITAFMDCLDADIKFDRWQKKYGGKK